MFDQTFTTHNILLYFDMCQKINSIIMSKDIIFSYYIMNFLQQNIVPRKKYYKKYFLGRQSKVATQYFDVIRRIAIIFSNYVPEL